MSMSRIPKDTVDLVASKVRIEEVVGRYVALKTRGRRSLGLCPFHGERTPSFSVDHERGLWYCFGCSEGGSVFNFLMRIEGLSFPQAVRRLAEEVGVEISVEETDDPREQRRKLLLEILERTALYYAELLHRSPLASEARSYLEERGFSLETAKTYRLGWAPAGGKGLQQKLSQAGYQLEDGVAAGLLRERSGRHVDLLRERLVFPITDPQGKVLAFGGRVLEVPESGKVPKYLNTPETEVYQKREQLYGLSFHRGGISRAKEALVMEGYLDVLAVGQAGIPLAVASLGTALTEEQCRLLARYARTVHLFYDADRAGRNATEKAIELFEKTGLLVQVALLQPGQDPDSLLREKGVEAFQKVKDSTVGVVDYLLERKAQEFDLATRQGKEFYLDAILPSIAKIRSGVVRSDYVRRLATSLALSEVALEERLRPGRGKGANQATHRENRFPSQGVRQGVVQLRSSTRAALHAEERLLASVLRKPDWWRTVADQIRPDDLTREDLRPCLEVLFQLRSNERPVAWSDLPDLDPERQSLWARLMAADVPDSTQEEMERLIRDIKRNGLKPRLEALSHEVRAGLDKGTIDHSSPLYQEYLDLQQRVKGSR